MQNPSHDLVDNDALRLKEPFAPTLSALVSPIDPARFVAEFWQKQPLYVAGSEGRLGPLARLFFEFDIEKILHAADLGATAAQAPLRIQRVVKHGALPAPAPDVPTLLMLHSLGSQLYMATSGLAGVKEWIENISMDLGRLWSSGRGDVYATRAGGGLDVHFDKNDNFTIQLQGRKVWRYSTAPYAVHPLYNSGDQDRLGYRPSSPFRPDEVDPSRLREVCLKPGDMLYLPRGFLHGTEANEDSLSFNLSFGPQPWAHVVLSALQTYLIRDPVWRHGATRDPLLAEERLVALRAALDNVRGSDLTGLNPTEETVNGADRDLGNACQPTEALGLRRNPLARWNWIPASEDTIALEIICPDESVTEFEVSEEFMAILDAIPDGSDVFPVERLLTGFKHSKEDAADLIELLVESGLLSKAP